MEFYFSVPVLFTLLLLPHTGRAHSIQTGCDKADIEIYESKNRFRYREQRVLEPLEVIESKSGSQGGFWIRDAAGIEWLLKSDAGPRELQTSAEVITSKIYRYLGYRVPAVSILNYNGKRYAAVKRVAGDLKESNLRTRDVPKDKYFRQLRFFAAYLKDWDRLIGRNNLVDEVNGEYWLLDFGGSLGAKASGQPKPGPVVSPAIGSFAPSTTGAQILDTFSPRNVPENHPWNLSTAEDREDGHRKLHYLTDRVLREIISQAEFRSDSDSELMFETLANNRDRLIEELSGDTRSTATDLVSIKEVARDYEYPELLNIFHDQSISENEKSALNAYANTRLAFMIPPYLKGLGEWQHYDKVVRFTEESRNHVQNSYDSIKALAARQPDLPVGMRLYRGTRGNREPRIIPDGNSYIESFLPTSSDLGIGLHYASQGMRTPDFSQPVHSTLTTYIVAAEGVKGILVSNYELGGFAGSRATGGEREILLPGSYKLISGGTERYRMQIYNHEEYRIERLYFIVPE